MANLLHCQTNLSFFYISLLHCFTNLNLFIICCLFSGDMYLSFGVPFSSLFCECNSSKSDVLEDFFETLVIFFSNFVTN